MFGTLKRLFGRQDTLPPVTSIVNDDFVKRKVVLYGDSGVGKTCIMRRMSKKQFRTNESPTIGATFTQTTVNNDNGGGVKVGFWDCAGQERFKTLMDMYMKDVSVCLVVYDLSDPNSGQHIQYLWEQVVKKNISSDTIIYVVGNKLDLVYKNLLDRLTGGPVVQNGELGGGASEIVLDTQGVDVKVKYFKISALNDIGINEMCKHIWTDVMDMNEDQDLQVETVDTSMCKGCVVM